MKGNDRRREDDRRVAKEINKLVAMSVKYVGLGECDKLLRFSCL